jgi:CDP-diglyceride synthetase
MKHLPKLSISCLVTALIILITLIQIPDLFGSIDKVQRILLLSPLTFLALGILIISVIRFWRTENLFTSKVSLFIKYSFLVTFGLALANFVYSLTRINYPNLGIMSAGFGILWLLSQPNNFFSKYKEAIIALAPVLIMLFFLLMYFWPFEYLKVSLREDGPVEWLQFLMIAISAILSILIAFKLFISKNYLIACIFIIIGSSFIFLAGEEISWGQRLFNVATPDSLENINRQKEISVHNISSIEGLFFSFQILISIYKIFIKDI